MFLALSTKGKSVLDIFGEIVEQEQLHLVDFRDHITGF